MKDFIDMQRMIGGYYKQHYALKIDNVGKIDKFLEKYN